MSSSLRPLCFLLALALFPSAVTAQEATDRRREIWDLRIGSAAADINPADYQEYACGTNGGPPGRPLADMSGFGQCPAETNGLHEVTFNYDDELEYVARALELTSRIDRYEGTRAFGHHIIASVLIDDGGTIRGIRIVTDNRVSIHERTSAYLVRHNMRARFGLEGWTCDEGEPDDRRQPVGREFVDERCTREVGEDLTAMMEAQFYRKAGQEAFDPATHELTPGRFESSARLEVYQRPFAPPATHGG